MNSGLPASRVGRFTDPNADRQVEFRDAAGNWRLGLRDALLTYGLP